MALLTGRVRKHGAAHWSHASACSVRALRRRAENSDSPGAGGCQQHTPRLGGSCSWRHLDPRPAARAAAGQARPGGASGARQRSHRSLGSRRLAMWPLRAAEHSARPCGAAWRGAARAAGRTAPAPRARRAASNGVRSYTGRSNCNKYPAVQAVRCSKACVSLELYDSARHRSP